MSGTSVSGNSSILDAINEYYATKADFSQHIGKESKEVTPTDELEQLQLDHSRIVFLRPTQVNMPVHPAEEHATGNITDQVAKESSDSTASTHEHHQSDTGVTSGGSLGAMAHKAHPGPVVAENIGQPASKEELRKRAEELNK